MRSAKNANTRKGIDTIDPRTRRLIDLETHEAVFTWKLRNPRRRLEATGREMMQPRRDGHKPRSSTQPFSRRRSGADYDSRCDRAFTSSLSCRTIALVLRISASLRATPIVEAIARNRAFSSR